MTPEEGVLAMGAQQDLGLALTKSLSPSQAPQSQTQTQAPADVESFTGRIVYNPDGSAFIIDSESSEDSSSLPLPSQEGAIVDGRGLTPPRGTELSIPQVVNAYHIHKAETGDGTPSARAAGGAERCTPLVHSYRVFSVRARNGKTRAVQQKDQEPPQVSGSLAQFLQESLQDGEQVQPARPILMCFLCKLSFGFSKSFVGHATNQHGLSLGEDEAAQLERRAVSAIIQGVGREKEPILSFLEPLRTPLPASTTSGANSAPSEVRPETPLSGPLVNSSSHCDTTIQPSTIPASSSSPKSQEQLTSPPNTDNTVASKAFTSQSHNTSSTTTTNAISSNTTAGSTTTNERPSQQDTNSGNNSSASSSVSVNASNRSRTSSPTALSLVLSMRRSPSPPECTPSSPETLSAKAKELEELANIERVQRMAQLAEQVKREAESPSSQRPTSACSTGSSPSHQGGPSKGAMDQMAAQQAQALFSAMLQQQFGLQVCPQHPEGKPPGTDCNKCDANQARAAQLGAVHSQLQTLQQNLQQSQLQAAAHMSMSQLNQLNQLAMSGQMGQVPVGQMGPQLASSSPAPSPQVMHSRNSCKTLKCPKCNWHYKYQETLEIHMKEKHPENDMSCVYCLTNQPHPRLARGETYTCGYKPYRCDVCNYSTTTKGEQAQR